MSDNSDLLLVSNRCSKTSLVFEAMAYKLKHRQTEEISGMFQSGSMCTNLKVTNAISKKDHLETFADINSIALNIRKLTIEEKPKFDK
ncbi:hypothetical protein T03_147 [Trichinella britovi]|uniref:Uncharacterized protein n=1 Tax=Trichinella britovi TaxID=45882 RepID=A0A0V1D5T9_TRIBR|nr:hypothetical protein T03_147 [Trichinella britovi]